MRRTALAALTLTLVSGCQRSLRASLPDSPAALAGVWLDDMYTQTTFTVDGQRVVEILDVEGEVLTVEHSGWAADGFALAYVVPSTGYAVTITIHTIEQDTFAFDWSSVAPDGEAHRGVGEARRIE